MDRASSRRAGDENLFEASQVYARATLHQNMRQLQTMRMQTFLRNHV